MPESVSIPEQSTQLSQAIVDCLEDLKGQDIKRLNVSGLTTVADYMILVTGTSSRHVRALATNTLEALRDKGSKARGIEGEETGEWVLLDFGDVLVHVMRDEVRSFYDLESLWQPAFGKAIHDD